MRFTPGCCCGASSGGGGGNSCKGIASPTLTFSYSYFQLSPDCSSGAYVPAPPITLNHYTSGLCFSGIGGYDSGWVPSGYTPFECFGGPVKSCGTFLRISVPCGFSLGAPIGSRLNACIEFGAPGETEVFDIFNCNGLGVQNGETYIFAYSMSTTTFLYSVQAGYTVLIQGYLTL